MTIIILSDGYKGGTSKFLENFIINNLKNKINKIILIDKSPKKTFANLKKNSLLKIYKQDVLKNKKTAIKIFSKYIDEQPTFFFTNYAFLVIYFYFFFSKSAKLAITLHSGIFVNNLKVILATTLFSIMSLKINFLIFGSNSSKLWWFSHFPWMRLVNNKVIYNGIDPGFYKKKNDKKFRISFVGRLEVENNPSLFLELSLLNKKNKNLIFNVFGNGSLKQELSIKNNNVKFWGWSDLSKIYSNTDITIITAPLNNFPYTALESQSFGKPVITCSKGDIRKIITNSVNGYYFNEPNVLIFNKYLFKTILNYDFLSKNSYKNSKKFNLNHSCKRILSFIKN